MTVSSSTNRVSYSGNGSLTTFAYTFKVFDEGDLTVILRASDGTETVQTITTHYTVSGVGDAGGGNVTFVTAPTATETVVILREQPLTQGLDLVPNDPFPAQSLEEALDKVVFMTQKHEEELSRAIKASRTNTITGSEFTISASDRANKVFAFDSSGDVSITSELGVYRGNWAAGVSYNQRDLVKDSSNDNIYLANTAHTSSGATPLSGNADIAKWDLIVNAAAAASSASAAAASETAAAASETAAAASETAAAASETAAAASETAAAASETNAAASEAAAAASYDSFDDRYLGAKATDPTVDNDGDALIDGALYFDTTNNVMKVYDLGGTAWNRTTPTSAEQTNIDTVSGISANVTTVAGISSDVTSVAGISANVTTLAGLTSDITAVANVDTELAAVSAKITEVQTVANDLNEAISEIETVANDLTSGSFVAGTEYDFGSVADATSGTSGSPDGFIVTVYNNLSDITSVAGQVSNISTLAPISASITTVAGISSNVTTVAGISANVTSVAGVSGSIPTVAGVASDVSTVAGISSAVSTVASNVSGINNFSDRYRVGTTEPTTSLDTGDLFYNTSTTTLKVYNGSAWEAGVTAGSGFLAQASNLSDLQSAATARTNLGLGTAATSNTGDFAAAVHNHDADYAALSHTHTLSDITDSGTMASQNANNVNITGGIIDGGSIV